MINIISSTLIGTDEREFMLHVYQSYEKMMISLAQKYVGLDDSEDVVQTAVIRLINNVKTLMKLDEKALIKYVADTVRTTAIRYRQHLNPKRGRPVEMDDRMEDIKDCTPTIEELLIAAEDKALFRAAWNDLEGYDKIILEQKYFMKMSDEAMAEVYQCKPSSIRMKLTRARRNIYRTLMVSMVCNSSHNKELFQEAIGELPKQDRELLYEKYIQGMSNEEIQEKNTYTSSDFSRKINHAHCKVYDILVRKGVIAE